MESFLKIISRQLTVVQGVWHDLEGRGYMTLRPRILTERLARVFRALYPLPGMAHGSKLLHQHRANVRATVSLPQIQYSLKNIKPLLMVILRLQKQSVFKQKTLCFSNPGFDKKIQVLGAVQVLESQVFPPSPQLGTHIRRCSKTILPMP